MSYTYKLYGREEGTSTFYTSEELTELTTLQLREICYKEKLVKGIAYNRLTREELIATIIKYRGLKEEFFIVNFVEDGFKRVEDIIKKSLGRKKEHYGKIKNPARMILYKGLEINRWDMYKVYGEELLEESNVLMVDDDFNLCAIFNLKRDTQNNCFYISMGKGMEIKSKLTKKYSLLYFDKRDSKFLTSIYYNHDKRPIGRLEYYLVTLSEVEIRDLEVTNEILSIDFGTSNTTAGTYLSREYIKNPSEIDILNNKVKLDGINYVEFQLEDETQYSKLFPTVISVYDISKNENSENKSSKENIEFKFGYDALKYGKNPDVKSNFSIFYEMKRWINSYNQIEEITDLKGNTSTIKRGDIIKAYIEKVIFTAEHQFKCKFENLHISTPIKLKSQFLDMFKILLSNYNIEQKNALDEGIAVLYNTIANQIQKNSFQDGKEYKALIIDCGGGTTDLSSCYFTIEDGHVSYKVDINTTFENGDINFGGNNLTYRIMQYIKIILANYYTENKLFDIDDILDTDVIDVYRKIDEASVEEVYKKLEGLYGEMENIIPTKFKEYENKTIDEYEMVRSNFYFLWRISEDLKQEFFKKTGIVRSTFHTKGLKANEKDLKITAVETWKISIKNNDGLKRIYDLPNVVFNINEISTLIKGDVYSIIKKFLEDFYEDGSLNDYSIIKLTGQSCRIELFRDAIKEFVAGRSIEFRQRDNVNLLDLKLSCLSGAIKYLNAKRIGLVDGKIKNMVPITPYSVSAFTHNGREVTLISSLEKLNQDTGFISRSIGTSEMEFLLKGAEGELRHRYIYHYNFGESKPITYEQINTEHSDKIKQDDVDNIINGEVKFFVYAFENKWGFHVLPIAREDGMIFEGKKVFLTFENEKWEINFFDGRK